jgi:hypothetical protein
MLKDGFPFVDGISYAFTRKSSDERIQSWKLFKFKEINGDEGIEYKICLFLNPVVRKE